MLITKQLKKRFVSDNNLPIQVFQEPYFSHQLTLQDSYNGALSKWNSLLNDIVIPHFQGNEMLFLEDYSKKRDLIITTIENSKAFQDFNTGSMDRYKVVGGVTKLPNSSVYTETNNSKTFISIDLKKANFQALKYHNSIIVNNTETYGDFIKSFIGETPITQYFIDSKYSRQVIFGKLNPSRHITIQKYIMNIVYSKLVEAGIDGFYSFTSDEIVISLDGGAFLNIDKINLIRKSLPTEFDVHLTVFRVELMKFFEEGCGDSVKLTSYAKIVFDTGGDGIGTNTTKEDFTCEYKNSTLMCAPSTFFPQIYRLWKNQEIVENDMVFYHEHRLAKFLNKLTLEK